MNKMMEFQVEEKIPDHLNSDLRTSNFFKQKSQQPSKTEVNTRRPESGKGKINNDNNNTRHIASKPDFI